MSFNLSSRKEDSIELAEKKCLSPGQMWRASIWVLSRIVVVVVVNITAPTSEHRCGSKEPQEPERERGPHTISPFFLLLLFLLLLLTFVLYKKLKYMLLGGHQGEKHRFFGPKATFGQQGVHAQKYSPVLLFCDRNFRFWNFLIGW